MLMMPIAEVEKFKFINKQKKTSEKKISLVMFCL